MTEHTPTEYQPDQSESPLASHVKYLLDHEEIRQAIYRYSRGVDRKEGKLVLDAYHEDAWDEHGNFSGDRQAVVAAVLAPKPNAEISASMHHIGNILIELDGDSANVETYFVAYQRRIENGNEYTRFRAGRYLDRFERRSGRWRVANRKVVDDWNRLDEVVATAAEVGPNNTHGTRDRNDASYKLSEFRP